MMMMMIQYDNVYVITVAYLPTTCFLLQRLIPLMYTALTQINASNSQILYMWLHVIYFIIRKFTKTHKNST